MRMTYQILRQSKMFKCTDVANNAGIPSEPGFISVAGTRTDARENEC